MIARSLVAALALAGVVSPASAATNQLTPDEIQSTFANGKPFTAVSTSGDVFVLTFKPDGSALETLKGRRKGSTGSWRVSDKGYCTTWRSNKEHCYTVVKVGAKYAVRGATGQLISTWTR